ncbi:DUF6332 family protein [Streptomyces sp. NPDC089919]|uniref:DUF6332 family protein n=1 Tax=Streptomyces sp. NPDC089919 TaxID=3155188 RepID=UPI003424789B
MGTSGGTGDPGGHGDTWARGQTDQERRDAITVEIGYAFVSACLAAALVWGALVGPVLLFTLPQAVEPVLLAAGYGLAVVVFVLRVVHVLWRFGRRRAGG